MTRHIVVSFSGGRTSAMMAVLIKVGFILPNRKSVTYLFANTGQEHDDTLRFVDAVDRHFNLGVIWLEADVNSSAGVGTGHTVTNFENAFRWNTVGGPFEKVINKYGITNTKFRHCTRELKQRPIESYIRNHMGLSYRDHHLAIGIRADEIDRMSPNAHKRSLIYPLIGAKITKNHVLDFWRNNPVDLRIDEREGNCLWCWKKSFKKLKANLSAHPEWFDFPMRMERDYGMVGPESLHGPDGKGRRFFRGNLRTVDLFDAPPSDENNGCIESCEVTFDE